MKILAILLLCSIAYLVGRVLRNVFDKYDWCRDVRNNSR